MNYNLRNAISGVYLAFVIDYSLALISRGGSGRNCKFYMGKQCRYRQDKGQ